MRKKRHQQPADRLVAEFAQLVKQGARFELLPGSPATVIATRRDTVVALITLDSRDRAQKLLGLPPTHQHNRRRLAREWELSRRLECAEKLSHAN